MLYVLKYEGKYVADFGYPKPKLTDDINKATFWIGKQHIAECARENGFKLGKEYLAVKCRLQEVT